MFGLDPKALIAGILLGFFILPMLVGMLTSRMGKKAATA